MLVGVELVLGHLAAIGDLSSAVALVIAVGVAWKVSQGGGGAAVSELSKANEVLEKRLDEQGKELRDLKAKNVELEQRTDFSAVLQVHEERATQRHAALLAVVSLIADRLGPDPP